MYICFEGVDGTGKSTILDRIAKRFEESKELYSHGIEKIIVTKEPSGIFRDIILDPDNAYNLNETARMFLYQADRAVHYENILKGNLNDRTLILSDRGPISTLVYQNYVLDGGIKGPNKYQNEVFDLLIQTTHLALDGNWPDSVFIFHVNDINIILKRLDDLGEKDYFDLKSKEFFEEINDSYLNIPGALKGDFNFVDASLNLDINEENIYNHIIKLIRGD